MSLVFSPQSLLLSIQSLVLSPQSLGLSHKSLALSSSTLVLNLEFTVLTPQSSILNKKLSFLNKYPFTGVHTRRALVLIILCIDKDKSLHNTLFPNLGAWLKPSFLRCNEMTKLCLLQVIEISVINTLPRIEICVASNYCPGDERLSITYLTAHKQEKL